MRIYLKYLVILLIVSLIPAAAVFYTTTQGMDTMGRAITAEAEQKLIAFISQQMALSAQNEVDIIYNTKKRLDASLLYLAAEAENELTQTSEPPEEIYYAQDFENESTAPEDLDFSYWYSKRAEDGRTVPLRVSYKHPVYILPPHKNAKTAQNDIALLHGLQPAYTEIFNNLDHMAFRIYVTLSSGVTAVYPGFAGYAGSYDPRNFTWYKLGRAGKGKPVWTDMSYSKSTGHLFFTLAVALYSGNGRFSGVAAVDVPVERFIPDIDLSRLELEGLESFWVFPDMDDASEQLGLKIMAGRKYAENAGTVGKRETEWLYDPSDISAVRQFSEMLRNIQKGLSGTAENTFRNERTLWAFAQMPEDAFAVKESQSENLVFLLRLPKSSASTITSGLEQTLFQVRENQQRRTVLVIILAALGVLLVSLYWASKTTKPIMELVDAWHRLALQDYSVRVSSRSYDERDKLVHAFNETVPKIQALVSIQHALQLAKTVQQNLLPGKLPASPGLDLHGHSEYCDETGGDYYDIYQVIGGDEVRFSVVIGDVSGHGVASALLMATARAMLKAYSRRPMSLAERVTQVNELLTPDLERTRSFMTLFCMEVFPESGRVSFVRAGHDPAYLINPETGVTKELKGEGLSLGLMDTAQFSEVDEDFHIPGQIIVIGTDGIWESRNPETNEEFGIDRFLQVVQDNAEKSSREIQEAVFAAVKEFCVPGQAPEAFEPEDDMTLVVIKKT